MRIEQGKRGEKRGNEKNETFELYLVCVLTIKAYLWSEGEASH